MLTMFTIKFSRSAMLQEVAFGTQVAELLEKTSRWRRKCLKQ